MGNDRIERDGLFDDELMERIAKGHEASFRKLFDRHSGLVIGYARRLLGGDLEKAEDISQVVWMKVIRSAPSYTGDGKFVSWVTTITRNTTLSELRRKTPIAVEEIESEIDEGGTDSFDLAVTKEQALKVREVLDNLPDPQRQIFTVWITEDVSYEDLAREFDTSVSSIKSHLFRTKQRLKEELNKS